MEDQVVQQPASQAAPVVTEATPTITPSSGLSEIARAAESYFATADKTKEDPAKVEEQPKIVEKKPDPVKVETPKEEPKKPEVDDLDARLARLAQASTEAAKARRAKAKADAEARQRADAAAKERSAHEEDLALAARIKQARATGKKLEQLKALGITQEELDSGFVIDLLNEMEGVERPPAVTKEQVDALVAAKVAEALKQREDAAKANAEKRKQEEAERVLAEGEEIIEEAKIHYKAGNYPLLKEENPSHGSLLIFKQKFEAANPGRYLGGKELLDEAEKYLRLKYEESKKQFSRLDRLLSSPSAVPVNHAARQAPVASPTSIERVIPPEQPNPEETYQESVARMARQYAANFKQKGVANPD